jgi:hypothetical protein
MRALRRVGVLLVVSVSLPAVFVGTGAARTGRVNSGVFCGGGGIAGGYYASIVVTGDCTMPMGTVTVRGNVTIAPGAGLNVVTHATLTVFGNVIVEDGGVLALGCSPAIGCSFTTHDRIYKSLVATDPASLIFHSATIGSVDSVGGSNGVNCDFNPAVQGPNYSTFEDNTIMGDVTVDTYDSCWFGFIRNHVAGSVTLDDTHSRIPTPWRS